MSLGFLSVVHEIIDDGAYWLGALITFKEFREWCEEFSFSRLTHLMARVRKRWKKRHSVLLDTSHPTPKTPRRITRVKRVTRYYLLAFLFSYSPIISARDTTELASGTTSQARGDSSEVAVVRVNTYEETLGILLVVITVLLFVGSLYVLVRRPRLDRRLEHRRLLALILVGVVLHLWFDSLLRKPAEVVAGPSSTPKRSAWPSRLVMIKGQLVKRSRVIYDSARAKIFFCWTSTDGSPCQKIGVDRDAKLRLDRRGYFRHFVNWPADLNPALYHIQIELFEPQYKLRNVSFTEIETDPEKESNEPEIRVWPGPGKRTLQLTSTFPEAGMFTIIIL